VVIKVGGDIKAKISWNGHSTVSIHLERGSALTGGNTCGLCADADASISDELIADPNAVYKDNAWWLAGPDLAVPPLFTPQKQCKDTAVVIGTNPCDDDPDARAEAAKFCQALVAAPGRYAVCHDKVDPREYYQNCLWDYCAMGAQACEIYTVYEDACTDAGVTTFQSVVDECGVCFGNGNSCSGSVSCTASGDPHYKTFDNQWHHWQGDCEYRLAGDCRNSDGCLEHWHDLANARNAIVKCNKQQGCVERTIKLYLDLMSKGGNNCGSFEVQARNSDRLGSAATVTVTVGIAVQIPGSGWVELGRGGITGHTFNGGPLPALPWVSADGTSSMVAHGGSGEW
jgi:hypothetical protein